MLRAEHVWRVRREPPPGEEALTSPGEEQSAAVGDIERTDRLRLEREVLGGITLLHEREADPEGGTAARGVVDADAAVQGLDDGGDDREAEAGAAGLARPRGVGAPEPLEDLLLDLIGDALAVVDDLDPAHPGHGID